MGSSYSISSVIKRKSKKRQGQNIVNESCKSMYPLYKTSTLEESYNYPNIRDSIYHWNDYSQTIGHNWSKVMSLFETVDKYGTQLQLNECATIINRDIIPYFQNPSVIKRDIYKLLNENHKISDHMKSHLISMTENLDEAIECDRVLTNFNIISKRFNINNFVSNNILFEDAVTDTIYSLCSLIDTYDIDYRTKFCLAAESTLYSVYNVIGNDPLEEEYLSKKLNQTSLLETVFDYFLINYGRNHVDKFLDEMSEVCSKDPFIGTELDGYINQLRKLQAQSYIENVSVVEGSTLNYLDDSIYGLNENMDNFAQIRESAINAMNEMSIGDIQSKAKEVLERIKIAPVQTVSLLKHAISTILVPCRAQDLAKGTHNVLSITFYTLITIGATISVGAFGIIFGTIASILAAKAIQKEYLKDAIQEWREHKYSVDRKIKECTDIEKKRRMITYQEQVISTLAKLEAKYEETRDRTLAEIDKSKKSQQTNTTTNNLPLTSKADVNPNGLVTPTSSIYDSKKDHNVKLDNETKKEDENKEGEN